MAKFDWVGYTCACPRCGKTLDKFQSKDGPCESITLDPCEVKTFYKTCPLCDAWVQFDVESDLNFKLRLPIASKIWPKE